MKISPRSNRVKGINFRGIYFFFFFGEIKFREIYKLFPRKLVKNFRVSFFVCFVFVKKACLILSKAHPSLLIPGKKCY